MPEFTTVVTVWHGVSVDLGFGYYVLALLLMIGMSNSTNLADGLDGLAGGLSILTALGLSWTVYTLKPGYERTAPLWLRLSLGPVWAFCGSMPIQPRVFMGDTGSLALGSSFAALAIVGKQEVLLLILGLVFLMETISVMIQVSSLQSHGRQARTGGGFSEMTPIAPPFREGPDGPKRRSSPASGFSA